MSVRMSNAVPNSDSALKIKLKSCLKHLSACYVSAASSRTVGGYSHASLSKCGQAINGTAII